MKLSCATTCQDCGVETDPEFDLPEMCSECFDVNAECQWLHERGIDVSAEDAARIRDEFRSRRYSRPARSELAPLAKVEPVETEVELLEAESF